MVKGKRRTEAAPRCLTRSNVGGSSSPALSGSLDGPKAAKDLRLDIPVINGAVAKSKRTAAAANGSVSKGARAMANSRDMITNYFSPARSPVTADDAESLPDSTTNSSKASSACSMDPHSGSLQHNMKTARLARTNSIDTHQHNCLTTAIAGATAKDSRQNQLFLVGSNSDEVETVSLVSSNDDLEEISNIHCCNPPAVDNSTTNPPPYKYHLHSRQQNHHHQQHKSSPVAAACGDASSNAQGIFAAVVSAAAAAANSSSSVVAADSMSDVASFSLPSAVDVDGCVAGDGSDTDDDCVVIEDDDDSDYNVPYQKTSKITNNFNGFTTSSGPTTRSLRSVRCLKNHTTTTSTTNFNNNSHLINNTSDATVSTTTITVTATRSSATDGVILPYAAAAAAVSDFSEVKEVNDITSSSSSSSSCCSCCSSTRSICSENITAGACTLTICDSSSKVSATNVALLNNSSKNRFKSESEGGSSIWRSPRKNNHQQGLMVPSDSADACTNGWAALVQEKRDSMVVAFGNIISEESNLKPPQHCNNEAVNSTLDHDCLSSQQITTRGLRSSPSKTGTNLHSSFTRKSPSTSPNYSLRNCSNSHNTFKSSKRDYFSSPGADDSSDDGPLLVDLTLPRHNSNSSYLSPKLSHSSPAVKQFFTDSSSKTSPSSAAPPSSESPFSFNTFVKTNTSCNRAVSIEHSNSPPSSSQPSIDNQTATSTNVGSPATPSTPHKIQVLLEEDPSDELFLSSPTGATALSRLSVLSPGDRAARGGARARGRGKGRGRKRLNVESVALHCDGNNTRDATPQRTSPKADQNNQLTSGDDEATSVTSPINGYSFRQSRTRSPFKTNGFLTNAASLEQQHGDKAPNHRPVSPEKVNGIVKPLTRTSAKLQQQAHQDTAINTLDNYHACHTKTSTASNNRSSGPPRSLRTASENVGGNSVDLRRANMTKAAGGDDPVPGGGKNMQMTDYFPIRRSERKPKATLLYERQMDIEKKILEGSEEGLRVENFGEKGRGVVTTRLFRKGEFVVEYVGDLLDMKAAKKRETKYSLDTSKGCYMYYFAYNDVQYCIDGTEETGYLGRLVNHSRTSNNLVTKSVLVYERPHLILVAKKDILPGTELLYDYGDRSKEALANHPWLAL